MNMAVPSVEVEPQPFYLQQGPVESVEAGAEVGLGWNGGGDELFDHAVHLVWVQQGQEGSRRQFTHLVRRAAR